MKINPSRGEIWTVDLDPTRGHEQAKARPCLVMSHDIFNRNPEDLIIVLPLTSKYHKISWLVPVEPQECGLKLKSYVMCHQIRVVSLERFSSRALGIIDPSTLQTVEERMRMLLDL